MIKISFKTLLFFTIFIFSMIVGLGVVSAIDGVMDNTGDISSDLSSNYIYTYSSYPVLYNYSDPVYPVYPPLNYSSYNNRTSYSYHADPYVILHFNLT